jgi:hypothetical protein
MTPIVERRPWLLKGAAGTEDRRADNAIPAEN